MYESKTILGVRGQITIPKIIREKFNLKAEDKLLVCVKANQIVINKTSELDLKLKEKLMAQAYRERAKEMLKLSKDLSDYSYEDKLLEDY